MNSWLAPPLYSIPTANGISLSRQERHSGKKNGQILLVRCDIETMVQIIMEAAMSAITQKL